eukprot:Nk52_evm5s157 gene=Nk52_evmTU5s157
MRSPISSPISDEEYENSRREYRREKFLQERRGSDASVPEETPDVKGGRSPQHGDWRRSSGGREGSGYDRRISDDFGNGGGPRDRDYRMERERRFSGSNERDFPRYRGGHGGDRRWEGGGYSDSRGYYGRRGGSPGRYRGNYHDRGGRYGDRGYNDDRGGYGGRGGYKRSRDDDSPGGPLADRLGKRFRPGDAPRGAFSRGGPPRGGPSFYSPKGPGGNGGEAMSFKQFLDTIPPNVDAAEAASKYETYKNEFAAKNMRNFFFDNAKASVWKELYDRDGKNELTEMEKPFVEKRRNMFFGDLDDGKLDGVSLDNSGAQKASTYCLKFNRKVYVSGVKDDEVEEVEIKEDSGDKAEENEEKAEEVEEGETKATPAPSKPNTSIPPFTLCFFGINSSVSRKDVVEVLKAESQCFVRLALSQPSVHKRCARMGWAHFNTSLDNDFNLSKIAESISNKRIENCQLRCDINVLSSKHVRFAPAELSTPERILTDLKNCVTLTVQLDEEAGFNEKNRLVSEAEDAVTKFEGEKDSEEFKNQMVKILDLLLLYMRCVHYFCYYGGCVKTECFADLSRRSGIIFVRRQLTEDSNFSKDNAGKNRWVENLDNSVKDFQNSPLRAEDAKLLGYTEDEEELKTRVEEEVKKSYCKREGTDRFKCCVDEEGCGKMFESEEFVMKHIAKKHESVIEEQKALEHLFQEYLLDGRRNFPRNSSGSVAAYVPAGSNSGQTTNSLKGPQLGYSRVFRGGYRNGAPNFQRPYYDNRRHNNFNNQNNEQPYPPSNEKADPRQIRQYVDLDAPESGAMDVSLP